MNSSYSMRRRACIRKVTYNFLWVFGVGFGSVEHSCVCSVRGEIEPLVELRTKKAGVVLMWVQLRTKKAGVVLMWVQFPRVAWIFLPESAFSADSLTAAYSPCVQSYASMSVCMLTVPNTGSHTIVWTHKTLHTLTGMGSAALVAAVPYPGWATQISWRG